MEKSFYHSRGLVGKKLIELLELATFALPTDPALLAVAPHAVPMKKKEMVLSVSAIQFLDTACNDVDIFCVFRHALPGGVRKICQERKAQIRIGVSKVMDFKPVKLALDGTR